MEILKNGTLTKPIGFALLILLVFWDAFITFQKGGENNPLWKPAVELFGLNILWVLAGMVLVLFYIVIRVAGNYTKKHEHYVNGEEIVLTNFVIAFATYDAYLTFVLPQWGYFGTSSHYSLIPILIIPILAYNIWLNWQRKKTPVTV